MRITLEQYLNGRDELYPNELTPEIRKNAEVTVKLVNALLAVLETEGIPLEAHPQTKSLVSSGWRPPQINSQVKGAAVRSKHMTGEACDLYDPEGAIDDYLIDHPEPLVALGLYQEHPSATARGWCHLQIVPPRSGRRVFYP
jgi:hypothetical protein